MKTLSEITSFNLTASTEDAAQPANNVKADADFYQDDNPWIGAVDITDADLQAVDLLLASYLSLDTWVAPTTEANNIAELVDGAVDWCWQSANNITEGYCQIDFPTPQRADIIGINCKNDTMEIEDYRIEGKNTGDSTWTILKEGIYADDAVQEYIEFTNINFYDSYRLFIETTYNALGWQIYEIVFGLYNTTLNADFSADKYIKQIKLQANEVDNIKTVRVLGVDSAGDYTVIDTLIMANSTALQTFWLNTTEEYEKIELEFMDFYGAGTEVKLKRWRIYEAVDSDDDETEDNIEILGSSDENIITDNLLYGSLLSTVTVTSTKAGGNPKEVLYDKSQRDLFLSLNAADQTHTFNFSSAVDCYGIVLINHNLTSDDAVILQASNDAFTNYITLNLTINDNFAYAITDVVMQYDSYRYIVTINGAQTELQLGEAFLIGNYRVYEINFKWNYAIAQDIVKTTIITQGVAINKIDSYSKGFDLNFGSISEAQFNFLQTAGRSGDGYVIVSIDTRSYFGLAEFSGGQGAYNDQYNYTLNFRENPS